MKEREEIFDILNENELKNILGESPTKLIYKFNDFEYRAVSKPRILSGLKKLDYNVYHLYKHLISKSANLFGVIINKDKIYMKHLLLLLSCIFISSVSYAKKQWY